MRCPDCQKFVSYDEPQCDLSSAEINGSAVCANVIVQLNCADCGTTLKDAEIEAETEFYHDCTLNPDAKIDKDFKDGDEQFELETDGDPEGNSRTENKDRNGKIIKNSRYMKTYYGFTLESEVKCLKCSEVFPVTLEGEEQASAFNECC